MKDDQASCVTDSKADSNEVIWNFFRMTILFSSNHGCVVSCLALATARFDSVGAWQTAVLYTAYVGSSLLGATYVVKRLGSLRSITLGMGLNCFYVGCFFVATMDWCSVKIPSIFFGAAIGGVGNGILWTAQGVFFAHSSEIHANCPGRSQSDSTTLLAGLFSFSYLAMELILRLISSTFIKLCDVSWSTVFLIYTVLAILTTFMMRWVQPVNGRHNATATKYCDNTSAHYSGKKMTATFQLFYNDSKMKYMFGLNAVFGLSAAYLNSYVNGEVVKIVLDDVNSEDVGFLGAISVSVASIGCILFGFLDRKIGKGLILTLGAVAFISMHIPFLVYPQVKSWGWSLLVLIYSLHGIGRATFEGTLRATFADFFPQEKEGAFANIIFQNGLASVIGYVLPYILTCTKITDFCVKYSNGGLHNVLSFELIVMSSGILAILGYWRAYALFQREHSHYLRQEDALQNEETTLLDKTSTNYVYFVK